MKAWKLNITTSKLRELFPNATDKSENNDSIKKPQQNNSVSQFDNLQNNVMFREES